MKGVEVSIGSKYLLFVFVLSEFVSKECSIGLWEAYVYQGSARLGTSV